MSVNRQLSREETIDGLVHLELYGEVETRIIQDLEKGRSYRIWYLKENKLVSK